MSGHYIFTMRDHFDEAAVICAVPDWKAYRWEVCDGGALVSGCVPSGVYTRGKNKGLPKFRPAVPGTERRVVVADAHMATVAAAYESKTGKCWDCKGAGQVWAGWSWEAGTKYQTCKRCAGNTFASCIQPDGQGE